MATIAQIADAERLRANAANEQRWQQALAEMKAGKARMTSLFDAARTQLSTVGQQAGADINRGAAQTQATQTQGLMTAGLGNTTIRGAMARGVETDRTASQARLAEGIAGQQSGLYAQQAGAEMGSAQAMAGFLESKQDVGPNMGQYASLAGQAAAGGGGGSGGGGSGWTPMDKAKWGMSMGGENTKSTPGTVIHGGGAGAGPDKSALALPGGKKEDPYASQIGKRIPTSAYAFSELSKAGRLQKRATGHFVV